MKYIIIVLLLVGILAAVTKPSDQQCINETARHYGGMLGDVGNALNLSHYAIRVEDRILFKVVYSELNGRQLAVGYFGVLSFEPPIKSMMPEEQHTAYRPAHNYYTDPVGEQIREPENEAENDVIEIDCTDPVLMQHMYDSMRDRDDWPTRNGIKLTLEELRDSALSTIND